jgi:hypothetical protein
MLLGGISHHGCHAPTSHFCIQLAAGANNADLMSAEKCTLRNYLYIHISTCAQLTYCFVAVWLMKVSFSFDVAIEVMTELVSQHQVSCSVLLIHATLLRPCLLHAVISTSPSHWMFGG